jgi:hypothetical protein
MKARSRWRTVPFSFALAVQIGGATSYGARVASLDIAREETRLELSVGVHARGKPMAITVALMPWFALDEGRVRETECSSCELELDGFGAAWGFGLVASGSLVWENGW